MGEVLLERDGNETPDQARRLCRWDECFQELLIHAAPRAPPFHHREMQGMLEAVNHHAAKVMSALIPGEQRQTVLLDGEQL